MSSGESFLQLLYSFGFVPFCVLSPPCSTFVMAVGAACVSHFGSVGHIFYLGCLVIFGSIGLGLSLLLPVGLTSSFFGSCLFCVVLMGLTQFQGFYHIWWSLVGICPSGQAPGSSFQQLSQGCASHCTCSVLVFFFFQGVFHLRGVSLFLLHVLVSLFLGC